LTFEFTVDGKNLEGSKWHAWGTFTNGAGDSGGDIVTGLSQIDSVSLQYTGSSVVASAPVVDESFPLASGTFTIVTVSGADGLWHAWGNV